MTGTTVPAKVKRVNVFERKLQAAAKLLEPTLEELLPREGRLAEAMRYAVLGEGKRFRPFLVLESAELFGVPKADALNVAMAIECLHCYSLVHDDLPAMDDDDMRRGKSTVHKIFGEATAILAGDALQSLAFEILAGESLELVRGLAQAAGWSGMAGGQQLDLETVSDVEQMSAMKTGALIRFAAETGAILANAGLEDRGAISAFGRQVGLAFQISDDLLDADKDAASDKKTFVTTLGVQAARKQLEAATNGALQTLDRFGARAENLRDAARFMLTRTN